MRWFAVDRQRFRRGGLHTEGQLETFDARLQFVVTRRRAAIETSQQIKLRPLTASVDALGAIEINNRHALRTQASALVNTRQEPSAPIAGMAFGHAAPLRIGHHHERRQITALTAKAVGHPRTHAGETHARHAGVDLQQRRRVVVGVGPAAMHKRHLVDVFGLLRENI